MALLPQIIPFPPVWAAVAIGLVLGFVVRLEPVWWLAWIAPAPLLILAFTRSGPAARWLTALAALIAVCANFHYYTRLMPVAAAVAVLLGQVLLWTCVVGATRRIVLRYRSWWTVFAYPVLWVTADMLMATFLPDGNWASLAYSQAEVLPVLQLTSLFGVAGLLFVLALVPSALAVGLVFGSRLHRPGLAWVVPLLLLAGSIAYGEARLQQTASGPGVVYGMAAIDDAIGPKAAPAHAEKIWNGYEELVATLAAQGAQVIVLPEKIALGSPLQSESVRRRLGAMAARHHVWIEAGMATDDTRQRRNLAWLFTPGGILAAEYQKHFMAPPEREFAKGGGYSVSTIGGLGYGMAICKDMHFAALGRAYGQRQAAVMLVPAWDFGVDRWMGSRITLTRGVENGYAVVRASREGLLTVSDGHGRVIAERRSGPLPGTALLATVRAGAPTPTLYKQTGDLFGWLCVGAGVVMLAMGMKKSRGQKSWCQV
jgi:apolipoprotein N-acyltransferase